MASHIAVDVGGTFTDLVYFDGRTGAIGEAKVATTPDAPERGVLRAIEDNLPAGVLADAGYFLHGTTVGLNAILERRGARVGLLCTEGFRDILEIRRGDRGEMFNLFWRTPEPLVPRHLRIGVAERLRADGTVHRALAPDSVHAALERFQAERVDSIAVCLINAWANPVHELRVMELIRESGFDGGVSLSHRISGEYREYERTSTTVVDAFVRGRMADYLARLRRSLEERGFRGESLITRSGGGAMTFDEAAERPFETIMSGPVAGALGAAALARTIGIDALVTADVGGTSFDTTLVLNGQPSILYEGEIGGMAIQAPWVDVRSIGSGGGSIATVYQGGLMRVGPESAGAEPGPAAYGRGGSEPTTTDAAAHLGMFGRPRFEAGIVLDREQARAALAKVAAPLGKSVDEVAVGIVRIAAASMGNAMREITVERGLDPRTMTLLPFGGAGPLLAVLLADELEMNRIVVPPIAGNFSAYGLLGADVVRAVARTILVPLDEAGLAKASAALAELHAGLEESGPEAAATAQLDLRYQGQEHWLSIAAASDATMFLEEASEIASRYRYEYRSRYGGVMEAQVEIIAVRAQRTKALPRWATVPRTKPPDSAKAQTCDAYSLAMGKVTTFALIDRDAVAEALPGPAIVTERTATLYVDAGWSVRAGNTGELVLTREAISLG